MKLVSTILLLFLVSNSWGQRDTFMVNNTCFIIVTKTQWREGSRDTVALLYRQDSAGQTKYLLTHTIFSTGSDCNNIFEDHGSYQTEDDKIIFITDYWQRGSDPIPSKRKQIYQVKKDGKLIEIYDKQLVPWEDGWINTNE